MKRMDELVTFLDSDFFINDHQGFYAFIWLFMCSANNVQLYSARPMKCVDELVSFLDSDFFINDHQRFYVYI